MPRRGARQHGYALLVTRGARRGGDFYQLVRGVRNRLGNVGPDGSLPVQTSRNDRGSVDFILSVGKGTEYTEQQLSVPLACPMSGSSRRRPKPARTHRHRIPR